jgi:hypothetical protein
VKVTIEIHDHLLERIQQLAREENTTVSALVDRGLRLVLEEKEGKSAKWKWNPVTCGGGLTGEFKNASWEKIRDEIYKGRGS